MLAKSKKVLQKVFSFIRKHWKVIAGGLAIIIAIISVFCTKKDSIKELIRLSKLELAKNKKEVAVLEAKKKEIEAQTEVTEEEIQRVDLQIEAANQKIEKHKEAIASLTLEEKFQKFNDLGY